MKKSKLHKDGKTPVIKIRKSIYFFYIPVRKTEDKFTFVVAYVRYLLYFYRPAPVWKLRLCYVGKTGAPYYWSSSFCRPTRHLENSFLFSRLGPTRWKMYRSFACPAQPTGLAGYGYRARPGHVQISKLHAYLSIVFC